MMIVEEIKFVIKMMNKSPDLSQKLYYFSGVHALIHRIFNQDFDEDLIFAHLILNNTHGSFMTRLNVFEKGGDKSVYLYEDHFDGLIVFLKEFAGAIEKKKSINDILKKFAVLSYSTTGNGFYLLQKGLLKFKNQLNKPQPNPAA